MNKKSYFIICSTLIIASNLLMISVVNKGEGTGSNLFVIAIACVMLPVFLYAVENQLTSLIMLRISGVLSILLTRRTKDNTVNKSKATDPVRIKETIRFSTAYKNDGNITQAIAITNRLLPVSSPLFTTEIMRRFDAMINVEQMIK